MDIKEWYSQLGKKSARLMTRTERIERARKGAIARWGNANSKHKKKEELVIYPKWVKQSKD